MPKAWLVLFFCNFSDIDLKFNRPDHICKQKKKTFWFIFVPMNFTLHRKLVSSNQEVGIYSSCGVLCQLLCPSSDFVPFCSESSVAKQKQTVLGIQTEVKVKGWLNILQSRTQMVRLKKPFPKRKRQKWNVVGTELHGCFSHTLNNSQKVTFPYPNTECLYQLVKWAWITEWKKVSVLSIGSLIFKTWGHHHSIPAAYRSIRRSTKEAEVLANNKSSHANAPVVICGRVVLSPLLCDCELHHRKLRWKRSLQQWTFH